MNKKLVALAIGSALSLPIVAQAQTANVTLYGRGNVSMEVVSGQQANGSDPHVFRVNSNSSRFGLRGTESLGGGLSAIFQIESGVPFDVGGGTLAGRDTFVGLQGGWGTFKLGLYHHPYDSMHAIFGSVPTAESSILADSALWAQGTVAKAAGSFDQRLPNSVRYDSPNFAGLTASVAYSSAETANHAGVFGGSLNYANGPLEAGAAWQLNEDLRAQGLDDNAYTVAAAWNFGFLRLGAAYERLDYDTPTGDLKRDMWGASVTVPMGAGTWYASYQHAAEGKGGAANGTRIGALAKGPDSGANHWTLSYTYAMSKRTYLYTGYSRIDNKANANYTFNINPYPVANGANPSGFVLGMWHNF